MLSNGPLTQLYHDLGLSPQAQVIIADIRASPPSRHVRGAAGNVNVRYASRQMGVTIQAASHRNELAGIYDKEHDPATQEDDDQTRRSSPSAIDPPAACQRMFTKL
jgi:putative transposase